MKFEYANAFIIGVISAAIIDDKTTGLLIGLVVTFLSLITYHYFVGRKQT